MTTTISFAASFRNSSFICLPSAQTSVRAAALLLGAGSWGRRDILDPAMRKPGAGDLPRGWPHWAPGPGLRVCCRPGPYAHVDAPRCPSRARPRRLLGRLIAAFGEAWSLSALTTMAAGRLGNGLGTCRVGDGDDDVVVGRVDVAEACPAHQASPHFGFFFSSFGLVAAAGLLRGTGGGFPRAVPWPLPVRRQGARPAVAGAGTLGAPVSRGRGAAWRPRRPPRAGFFPDSGSSAGRSPAAAT